MILKIISVLGARPQFIKSVILNDLLSKRLGIENIIIHTGQHFDENMSLIFFDELLIKKPKYNLNINSLSHGAMTGRQLEQIEKIFFDELPDLVIVYGDTNSTLAGALAASKLNIPLAHIESGLRSFNLSMPEEVNRILTDRISSYLFTPSKIAAPWPPAFSPLCCCMITLKPIFFASSIVPSVEPPSITTISSAHDLSILGKITLIPLISFNVSIITAVDIN